MRRAMDCDEQSIRRAWSPQDAESTLQRAREIKPAPRTWIERFQQIPQAESRSAVSEILCARQG